ncbi:MAG: AbrB/MazE/SpoVT family DNA-binding domain-containing protein [Candidatus Heimdallarchaeota archaeon]
MAKIIFKRKLVKNKASLQFIVPKEIVEALGLEKGDTIGITLEDDGFYCRKVKQGEER